MDSIKIFQQVGCPVDLLQVASLIEKHITVITIHVYNLESHLVVFSKKNYKSQYFNIHITSFVAFAPMIHNTNKLGRKEAAA